MSHTRKRQTVSKPSKKFSRRKPRINEIEYIVKESCGDSDQACWIPIGDNHSSSIDVRFSEAFLNDIRTQSRNLLLTNEFAINAIENRINYIIGTGHRYYAIPNRDIDVFLSEKVKDTIENFCDLNQWTRKHQEIIRRKDRDGEVFLRFFQDMKKTLEFRFVEPSQVFCPLRMSVRPEHSFGIHTSPNDVESVLGYWIDEKYVDASDIQHRKENVDENVKRGIPLFYPVQKNFRRIEKLLRNMSAVAEIQSSIALVRKHSDGSPEALRKYIGSQHGSPLKNEHCGDMKNVQRFAPGTIIDAFQGTEYQFPIAAIDASRFILILQAELRAIASRLVMPEFMLTSDASNGNYASTMVAEGPAVRMFERLQYSTISDDLFVFQKVIEHEIRRGILPDDTLQRVKIHAIPPILAVRDRLNEAKADEILLNCGVLSAHTMSMRYGLDPAKESNLRQNCSKICNCDLTPDRQEKDNEFTTINKQRR